MQIQPFDSDNKTVELVFWGKVDFDHHKRIIIGLDNQNFYFANDLLPKFAKNFKPNKKNEMSVKLNSCYFLCFCLCLEEAKEKYILADQEMHNLLINALRLMQQQQQETFLLT